MKPPFKNGDVYIMTLQKIWKLNNFGGSDQLELSQAEIPTALEAQVIVKNEAIGLNYLDVYFRTALYPWPNQNEVKIPGSEAAGVITEIGAGVSHLKVGERVTYVVPVGAYAEYVCVPAKHVAIIPDSISFETAAASLLKGVTAYYLLHDTFELKAGQTALVHAAAGGVGQLLGQWGAEIGATMIGTAGGPKKSKVAAAAKYHHVIDYNSQDFVAEVMRITENQKVEVAYDSVAKTVFPGTMDCIKPRGLWVVFGQASGPITDFNIGMLAPKGSLFVTRPALFNYIATQEQFNKASDALFSRIADGRLVTGVHGEMSFDEIPKAHDMLENRQTTGSVVFKF